MPDNKLIKGKEAACFTCVRREHCASANENITSCERYFSLQDQAREQQARDDLIFTIKTKQGARIYLDRINKYVFDPQPFTGNSLTNYNLGMRGLVMDELFILIEALDLDNYTDLVIYLNNIITRGV